jgi:hypothetical protein
MENKDSLKKISYTTIDNISFTMLLDRSFFCSFKQNLLKTCAQLEEVNLAPVDFIGLSSI